jgi:hypothetical protein
VTLAFAALGVYLYAGTMARSAGPRAMREAVHLLRPADRDRDPAGPVPRVGIAWHIDHAKPPRCSLASVNGPSVKTGEPLLGSTLHTAVDASRPPSLKTKTPASVISVITALAAVPRSRISSAVRSGTHSSLNAIRLPFRRPVPGARRGSPQAFADGWVAGPRGGVCR